jgi:protein involved in polysaccharide export with SLBB domain
MLKFHRVFGRAGAWLGLLALAVSGGCASHNGPRVKHEFMLTFTPEQKQEQQDIATRSYRIHRGDVFAVFFTYNKEKDQQNVMVLPDGTASLQGLDQLYVAGLTVPGLDSLLTDRYAEQLRDPDLSVVMQSLAGRKVYVLGEVNNPGLFDLPVHGLSVLGAVAMAGGFTNWAGRGSIAQIRVTPEGYLCRELDIGDIKHPKSIDVAVLDLEPFDVIYVSRSWIGDFASFSREVATNLLQYTRLWTDVRLIEDPERFWRR